MVVTAKHRAGSAMMWLTQLFVRPLISTFADFSADFSHDN